NGWVATAAPRRQARQRDLRRGATLVSRRTLDPLRLAPVAPVPARAPLPRRRRERQAPRTDRAGRRRPRLLRLPRLGGRDALVPGAVAAAGATVAVLATSGSDPDMSRRDMFTGPKGHTRGPKAHRHGASLCRSRGNSVVSRMFVAPTRRASQRSRPIAKPPCGGMP